MHRISDGPVMHTKYKLQYYYLGSFYNVALSTRDAGLGTVGSQTPLQRAL